MMFSQMITLCDWPDAFSSPLLPVDGMLIFAGGGITLPLGPAVIRYLERF
jgi:hypothetical protein